MCWTSTDGAHEGAPATHGAGDRTALSYSARGFGLEDGTYVPDEATIGWRAQCSCGWKAVGLIERVTDADLPPRPDQILDLSGGPAFPEVEDICHAQWLEHVRRSASACSTNAFSMTT
jgi:hypothetical protein